MAIYSCQFLEVIDAEVNIDIKINVSTKIAEDYTTIL